MSENVKISLQFALFALLQVLIFNQIHLFGLGCVFVYCYFIITLPFNRKQGWVIFLGFLLGAIIDIFTQGYGIHAFATTLIAYLRPYIVKIFVNAPDWETLKKSSNIHDVSFFYIATLIVIHHFTLFILEAFSFKLFFVVIYKTFISSILTIIFVLLVRAVFHRKRT
ncbi:MAG: rod shape-determining protein MreD [Prevotellaceae bacterium]|jgi:rod shape-determining protein MreD|nr:rod shape-determining protein MreD [Prevotellaceae bacterium]